MFPFAQTLMTDPVQAADGVTYDRRSISQWLLTNDTSPVLGERMQHSALQPNEPLRAYIASWLAAVGGR